MASTNYRLADEPLPSRMQQMAVNPLFPLLAIMFAGAWAAWPWFAVNAEAMGSPTRRREWQLITAAVVGSLVLALVVLWADEAQILDATGVRFAILGLQVWKLGFAYRVQMMQGRTFELFTYYGGEARNALPVLIGASLLRGMVLGLVEDVTLLVLVLA